MRIRKLFGGLVLLCLAGGAAAMRVVLNPTITPTSHDFGDNVIGVQGNWSDFTVTVPTGGGHTNALRSFITGPDAADFRINRNPGLLPHPGPTLYDCQNVVRGITIANGAYTAQTTLPAGTCQIAIEFIPRTLGPKTATLRMADQIGMTSATLKGNGVYGCRMDIVPCNYALHYSGTFSWFSKTVGQASTSMDSGTVVIQQGVAGTTLAMCNGLVESIDNGVTSTGVIRGPGLFAVEFFDNDPLYPLVYSITVACPSPAFPATANQPATPSEPAELGHGELKTYNQPAPHIGVNLSGTTSLQTYSDPINGVTAHETLAWNLTGLRAPPNWWVPPSQRQPPP